MFERRRGDDPTEPAAPPKRAASLLSTSDIVARVERSAHRPWARFVRWTAFATGVVALIVVGKTARDKASSGPVQPRQPAVQPALAAPVPPATRHLDAAAPSAQSATPVSIVLSQQGSVFVDGHYVGMHKHLQTRLVPGEHTLLVRFGPQAYQSALRIGHKPGDVHCDRRRGCGPFKTHAGR